MKGIWRSIALGIILSTLVAAAVAAETPLSGAGVLHQYCAAEDQSLPPNQVEMIQLVATDELATFGGTQFAVIYQPETAPEQLGRLIARIRIQRAEGGIEWVGKIVARQAENGEAGAEQTFPIAARAGDLVIWRYRLKRFDRLDTGECILLIGAAVMP
jgi:hypothetical protein